MAVPAPLGGLAPRKGRPLKGGIRFRAPRSIDRSLVAASRDHETAKRFGRENASRLFAQTRGGGWLRIEGERLQAGPKQGETWYDFEDM